MPEVWAEETFGLSDAVLNALSVVKFAAVAHLLLFVLLGVLLKDARACNGFCCGCNIFGKTV